MDSTVAHYSRLSRHLHWGMAALFTWMFITTGVRALLPDSALEDALWPTHRPLGALLMLLVVVRLVWALVERSRRPASVSLAASLGHKALYALMVAVPALALLRQYGSGRAFSPFGIPLMPGFEGDAIEWMTAAGSNFHGLLGWTLLALAVGHAVMAIWHHRAGGEEVLARVMPRLARGR